MLGRLGGGSGPQGSSLQAVKCERGAQRPCPRCHAAVLVAVEARSRRRGLGAPGRASAAWKPRCTEGAGGPAPASSDGLGWGRALEAAQDAAQGERGLLGRASMPIAAARVLPRQPGRSSGCSMSQWLHSSGSGRSPAPAASRSPCAAPGAASGASSTGTATRWTGGGSRGRRRHERAPAAGGSADGGRPRLAAGLRPAAAAAGGAAVLPVAVARAAACLLLTHCFACPFFACSSTPARSLRWAASGRQWSGPALLPNCSSLQQPGSLCRHFGSHCSWGNTAAARSRPGRRMRPQAATRRGGGGRTRGAGCHGWAARPPYLLLHGSLCAAAPGCRCTCVPPVVRWAPPLPLHPRLAPWVCPPRRCVAAQRGGCCCCCWLLLLLLLSFHLCCGPACGPRTAAGRSCTAEASSSRQPAHLQQEVRRRQQAAAARCTWRGGGRGSRTEERRRRRRRPGLHV